MKNCEDWWLSSGFRSVAEHWQLKLETLDQFPMAATLFLSFIFFFLILELWQDAQRHLQPCTTKDTYDVKRWVKFSAVPSLTVPSILQSSDQGLPVLHSGFNDPT